MISYYQICGCVIALEKEDDFRICEESVPFLCSPSENAVRCVFTEEKHIVPSGSLIALCEKICLYRNGDKTERVYRIDDGPEYAALTVKDARGTVTRYASACREYFTDDIRLMELVGLENILISERVIMLRADLYTREGKAVLVLGDDRPGSGCVLPDPERIASFSGFDTVGVRKKNGEFFVSGIPTRGRIPDEPDKEYLLERVQIRLSDHAPLRDNYDPDTAGALLRLKVIREERNKEFSDIVSDMTGEIAKSGKVFFYRMDNSGGREFMPASR